jgi:hypothetical protein
MSDLQKLVDTPEKLVAYIKAECVAYGPSGGAFADEQAIEAIREFALATSPGMQGALTVTQVRNALEASMQHHMEKSATVHIKKLTERLNAALHPSGQGAPASKQTCVSVGCENEPVPSPHLCEEHLYQAPADIDESPTEWGRVLDPAPNQPDEPKAGRRGGETK